MGQVISEPASVPQRQAFYRPYEPRTVFSFKKKVKKKSEKTYTYKTK